MLTHVTKAYKPVLCSVPEESSSQTILDTIGGRARGPGRGGALVFSPPHKHLGVLVLKMSLAHHEIALTKYSVV